MSSAYPKSTPSRGRAAERIHRHPVAGSPGLNSRTSLANRIVGEWTKPPRTLETTLYHSSGLEIADRLALLLGSQATLLIAADAPDRLRSAPAKNVRLWWHGWPLTNLDPAEFSDDVTELNDSQGADVESTRKSTRTDQKAKLRPPDVFGLVVIDDRSLLETRAAAEEIFDFLAHYSTRFAVISTPESSPGSFGLSNWAGMLADKNYLRAFDADPGLVSESLAVFEHGARPLADLVQGYETALTRLGAIVKPAVDANHNPTETDWAQQSHQLLVARHAALTDRDRVFGLMARMLSLQNEVDYLRTCLDLSNHRIGRLTDKLAQIQLDRRFRIGEAIMKPATAAKKLTRGKKSKPTKTQRSIQQ